jgi:dolichyl-diphosphooligosaccharide--protein glycosyltransferase
MKITNKIIWWILGAIIILSAVLRFVVPWSTVFKNTGIIFTEVDPYFHLRLADGIIHNWQANVYDPYLNMGIGLNPILAWIVSLLSFGNTEWLDSIAAFFPAVCGVLLTIPVYFIGRKLFGNVTGLLGALLIATVQGDMLSRTSLGFFDHHCLEVLLTISIVCCIVYAVQKNIWFILLSGLLLGLYFLIWVGAPIFLAVIDVYLIVQSIINHKKKISDLRIYWVMFGVNLIALCIFALFPATSTGFYSIYLIVLAMSVLLPLVLYTLFKLTENSTITYIIILLIIGFIGTSVLYFFFNSTFSFVLSGLRAIGGIAEDFISEEQHMTFQVLYNNIGMVSVFGLIGLVLMIVKSSKSSVLLIVWGIIAVVLAIFQRRFIYYLTPVMCITCAYVIVLLSKGLVDKYKSYENRVVTITAVCIFCLSVILVPNTIAGIKQNSSSMTAPTNAWLSACEWLKNDTELPYTGDSDYYYSVYNENEGNGRIGYRVLTWWDYGYWIVRIAQRPVLCSPGGGDTAKVAEILLSKEYNQAEIERLKVKYIVLDYTMIGLKYSNIQSLTSVKDGVNDTFMYKLWSGQEVGSWSKCWESKEKYNKDSQVKIFRSID